MHDQGVLLKYRRQRGATHPGGINQANLFTVVYLHQRQLRPEGAFAHEFRVQIQRGPRRQPTLPFTDCLIVLAPKIRHVFALSGNEKALEAAFTGHRCA